MEFDALTERGMDVSVVGYLKQKMAFRRERRREKVRVGPGLRECQVRYETNNCGEKRVRWRGPSALKGGQNMSVPRWVLLSVLGALQ